METPVMIMGRAWGCKKVGVLLLAAYLFLAVEPTWAYERGRRPGTLFFSGEGNLYYEGAAGAGVSLTAIALMYIVVPLLEAADDEDDWDDDDDWDWYDCDCHRDPHCDELDVPVEAYQFGGSAGVFLNPRFSLAWRMLVQRNDADDPVEQFLGWGPELTFHGRDMGYGVHPFLSVAGLYGRGQVREQREVKVETGPAALFRGGVGIDGRDGGIYLQASYQNTPLDRINGFRQTRAQWGIGLGFTVYID